MNRRVAVFRSHEDAEKADKEYYLSLTPLERLEILLELNRQWPRPDVESSERFQGFCRVIKRPRG
jgi:hypothetical protein